MTGEEGRQERPISEWNLPLADSVRLPTPLYVRLALRGT